MSEPPINDDIQKDSSSGPDSSGASADATAGGASVGPGPAPASRPVQAPSVPNTLEDADLEAEVQQALGDLSLMDMGDLADSGRTAQAGPKTEAAGTAGQMRRGKIVGVSNDGVFVDVGGKSQGFLPTDEILEGQAAEVGADLDVCVAGYDQRDGLLLLSQKTAAQQLFVENLREGTMVEARVTGTNKGGLELDIKGLKAFMPISQIDLKRIEDTEPFVGQKFICEVTQVEHGDKNVVLSRRNVLAREQREQAEKLWVELEEGQCRHGVVSNVTEYGAFIDLGGLDGLLHIKEMSWARIKHPSDILQVGQGIDVLVIGVDREKQRVSLSLRQAGGDPWTAAEQKYPVGSRHQAQIRNLMNFGAFAELEPGIDGLIPIGEMSWAGRIRHPSDVVQPGVSVEVEVIGCDAEKRRIALSMKNVGENPWTNVRDRYQEDQTYPGTVTQLTDFGAFVTLESGVDGLVHISELSDKHVAKVSDVVKAGDQVSVRVLSVDTENQRIALSMKAMSGEQETAVEVPAAEASSSRSGKSKGKKDRPRRGGLSF